MFTPSNNKIPPQVGSNRRIQITTLKSKFHLFLGK